MPNSAAAIEPGFIRVLIGAYPFPGTVRVGMSTSTYSVVFPLNWVLTWAQWVAVAWFLAYRARAKGNTDLGDQIILACALRFATNLAVRLLFLLLGLGFVTTQVRM